MSNNIELISLSELVENIKNDLLSPLPRERDTPPFLFIDGIEITAQVVAKREKGEGGKAGLSLSVLGFGADAGVDTKTTVSGQLTQTVTLKLSPVFDKSDFLKKTKLQDQARILDSVTQGAVRGQDGGSGELA